MEKHEKSRPDHLAWHETLEVHELVASQSNGLMRLKNAIGEVKDKKLKSLYADTIKGTEKNIRELLKYYTVAPSARTEDETRNLSTAFYATDLLILSKSAVKNYASAIIETATPALRDTFVQHLQHCIKTHAKVFNFMYEKGLYPAYDLNKLLKNDVNNAQKALEMDY